MHILDFFRRAFGATIPEPPKPTPKSAKKPSTHKQVDKPYPHTNKKTGNVSSKTIKPTHVVLHHSSGSYVGGLAWICDPSSRVSYHCLIARDGRRNVFALPNQRCWHAGVSQWQGKKDINSYSIGVAWEGDTYQTPLSEDAILSAVEYLLPILDEYHIPLANIIRHADVAPGRKDDCSPAAHSALLAALNRRL